MLTFPSPPATIVEIVLTGGSCAGKTTALQLLSQSMREQGYCVLTVPETVTMLATAGIPDLGEISRHDQRRGCLFQAQVYSVQRALRAANLNMARLFTSDLVVVLHDRGELDALAYHDHDCLQGFAAADGLSLAEIRDSYSAIMHLVTAANGAEAAYSRLANPARWDTADEARYFDDQIYNAWAGHPEHVVIDNSTDFIGKMKRLSQAVMHVIEAATGSSAILELHGRTHPDRAATPPVLVPDAVPDAGDPRLPRSG